MMLENFQIQKSFNRAATSYQSAALLQREVESRLLERLDYMRIVPDVVLDAGAGLCGASEVMASRYPQATVLSLDQAHGMLSNATRGRHRPVCGRMQQLPLQDSSVDLLFSNLALQWCTDLDRVFDEFRRVLKPEGIMLFSTFGPDTLYELRRSWSQVDSAPHVNSFPDLHDVGDQLVGAGFMDPVMDMERITVTYDRVIDLMRDLKAIGAHNVDHQRHRGFTGKQRMQNMIDAYEAYRVEDLLPATYEVVYGHAVSPDSGQPRREGDMQVTAVPLDRIPRR